MCVRCQGKLGLSFALKWNSFIKPVIILVLGWHLTKQYMLEKVDRPHYWDEVGENRIFGPELIKQTKQSLIGSKEVSGCSI